MTTRRSRLQIRPNIGRGAGSDAITKKACIASKNSPKKEAKENAKIEENNLTEQIIGELTDKISSKQSSDDKELSPKEISSASFSSSKGSDINNMQNSSSCTTASENYNTLFNTSRECAVVLDRTIVTSRNSTESVESCPISLSLEDQPKAESAATGPLHEKESCRERTLAGTEQNVHRSEVSNEPNLTSACTDANKEKNISKAKENVLEEDISTDSTGISQPVSDDDTSIQNSAKPAVQNSVVTSPERRPSSKRGNNEERSKRRTRLSKKPPERGTMTMMDLIFWNPPNNPMSQKKTINEAEVVVSQAGEEEEETDGNLDARDGRLSAEESSKGETEMPGPRVMVGPDGNITIDEDSLVIRRTDPEQIASTKAVQEVEACTYNSFRKQKPKHYWSDKETAKFYKALSILGTDFSLMMNFFPTRSRQELKNKFKREERLNRHLIDRAIRDPQQFDLTAFDNEDDIDAGEADDPNDADFDINEELKKRRKNNTGKKQKRRRTKNKDSFEDDDISEKDVSADTIPQENVGVRKSSRKRKETSKEITTYTPAPVVKRKCKPRKKKTEVTVVENESLEIVEVPSENLEVVTEDPSVIVCPSPSAPETVVRKETPSSNTHFNATEAVQSKEVISGKQQDTIAEQSGPPLKQSSISAAIISSNLLLHNSNQTNLTPGQLVLVPGKTDNANEQVVHVYVVSPPPCSQESLCLQQNSGPAYGDS